MKQISVDIFGPVAVTSRSHRKYDDRKMLQRIVVACAALPLTLLIILAVSGKVSLTVAGIYNLVLFLLLWSIVRFPLQRWLQGVALFLSAVNLMVVSPELFLRTIDFEYVSGVSFGGLRPERRSFFEPDDELMWKHRRGQPGINSFGFRGREVQVPKPKGVRRILFIGDSCTDQDFAGYVEQLLNRLAGGDSLRFECIIMAVPGYSSFQGIVIAQKYAELVRADIAFVYFGWNDHWLAYGGTDDEFAGERFDSIIRHIYNHSRLLQLGVRVSPDSPGGSESIIEQVRVPAPQFRDNLKSISSILTGAGTRVVFITAPSNHEQAGVPRYLVEQRLAPNEAFVLSRHRQYCDIVRDVAMETASGLLDLQKEMAVRPNYGLFMTDGIHFTDTGLKAVAALVYVYLLESGQA
ncbi:MAG: hypothetical protein JSV52_02295 [Candidatus Zixiibacteriota bacterium]|nr:MAG: hypothetical protein JSV52_02295 [candidate division Zixibacteria bacterium]